MDAYCCGDEKPCAHYEHDDGAGLVGPWAPSVGAGFGHSRRGQWVLVEPTKRIDLQRKLLHDKNSARVTRSTDGLKVTKSPQQGPPTNDVIHSLIYYPSYQWRHLTMIPQTCYSWIRVIVTQFLAEMYWHQINGILYMIFELISGRFDL